MQRKFLVLVTLAFGLLVFPQLARSAASTATPPSGGPVNLPAVENETPADAIPVISPQPSTAAVEQPVASPTPSIEFKSVGEARDKIRKAYLLRQYDEVLSLGKAAVAQFPDESAFEFYVKRAEEMLKPTDAASEHSPAFRRLREQRRNASIQSIMKSVAATSSTAAAAPGAVQAAPAEPVKPAPQKTAVSHASGNEEPESAPLPPPRPARASSMDKIKQLAANPMALYGAIGALVIGIAAAVLMKRKGGAPAEEKKPKKSKETKKAAQPETETVLAGIDAEPKPSSLASAMGDLDSLFKPSTPEPAPAPVAESTSSVDNLDALFAQSVEPTKQSKPEAELPPGFDSLFNQTPEPDTKVPVSGPIRLDDSPIELPVAKAEPAPVDMSSLDLPEIDDGPITVAPISLDSPAEPEPVAPISLSLPEADPFFKPSAPAPQPEIKLEPKPAPIELPAEEPKAEIEFSSLDLPSIDETRQDQAVDVDAMMQPIVPEVLEPPSGLQPEYAATRGFFEEQPTMSSTAFEETATGDLDLPTVDTTPAVAVHEDETLVLDDDTKQVDQQTAVSPAMPGMQEAPAGEDLFSREYHKGMSDFVISNWAGAVHHLSIAAALKPSAVEVKEKLREARRKRKETDHE